MFNNKIEAYVIFDHANRFYFTHLDTSFGCVILTPNEKTYLTDFRYGQLALKNLLDYNVIITTHDEFYKDILKELKRLKVKSVGYEDQSLTVNEFKIFKSAFVNFTLKPASDIINLKRAIKTDNEIEALITAQRLAEKVFHKVVGGIKAGIAERDVAAEIVSQLLRAGAEGCSFDSIVAFGENSSCPHHRPTEKRLEKSDMILIDFGAKYQGYCSDMTRSFCLTEPNSELASVHDIVLEAQNYALKHIKAGMTCREADSLAREYIKANGYAKEFGHALGHGVGVQIHESPRLSFSNEQILLPNMVVTIEPGIYIDGLGGVRIEDTVVIKESGVINITNFNKNINI